MTEIESWHTPSVTSDRRSSFASDGECRQSSSQLSNGEPPCRGSPTKFNSSCHSAASSCSTVRRSPVIDLPLPPISTASMTPPTAERPVLIPLNNNNNHKDTQLVQATPKRLTPSIRSLSADHAFVKATPKTRTPDLITSIRQRIDHIPLGDFYRDELEEILADQSQFILEAQQEAKLYQNRQNVEATRLLEVCKKQPLPIKTRRTPEYTVVLDLDETLVHASLTPQPNSDCQFEVVMPDGTQYAVYVKLRPGLMEFLKRLSENYELVLFTASKQVYAEKLISMLDPDKKYIKYRLYRDHCRQVMLNYVKDLTVMARDLAKTVIVDNSPQAFSFQVENGIPIRSWFGDEDDNELEKVADMIDKLCEESRKSVQEDIRPLVTECFNVQKRVDRYADCVISNAFLDSLIPPQPPYYRTSKENACES